MKRNISGIVKGILICSAICINSGCSSNYSVSSGIGAIGGGSSEVADVDFDQSNVNYKIIDMDESEVNAVTISDLKLEQQDTARTFYNITGLVTNENDFPVRVSVHYSCLDSSGVQIGEAIDNILSVPAKGSARLGGGVVSKDLQLYKIDVAEIHMNKA